MFGLINFGKANDCVILLNDILRFSLFKSETAINCSGYTQT